MKRFASILLALVIVLSLAVPAFAQTEEYTGTDAGKATITVQNPAKGVEYKLYKLFAAEMDSDTEPTTIIYSGTIPASLADYFEKNAEGSIVAKTTAYDAEKNIFTSEAVDAMSAWANGEDVTPIDTATFTSGSTLEFTKLPYGLYVLVSGQGTAISVNSTFPNAQIWDKNTTEPDIVKGVDKTDINIGDTVTYTATATTSNYLREANATADQAKKVTKYTISDTLPDFLKDVNVTSITIDGKAYTVGEPAATPQFDANKQIIIPWVDAAGAPLYANGAQIVVTYTATVTAEAAIDGAGNKNTVTLSAHVEDGDDDGEDDPWEETWSDDEIIWTYAAALKKVVKTSAEGVEPATYAPLAGAKFAALGLSVTGSDGLYTVVSYDPTATTYGNDMETDDEGNLVILGLQAGKTTTKNDQGEDVTVPTFALTVTETEAPIGYNKLVGTIQLPTAITRVAVTATTTTVYYDENGNKTDTETNSFEKVTTYTEELEPFAIQVENKKGLELPSTGGMGTTMFYVVGAGLMLAAAVLLVTKKRMASN